MLIKDIVGDMHKQTIGDNVDVDVKVATNVDLNNENNKGTKIIKSVLEKFIPHLHSLGISNIQTDKMLIDNPKKILQFIAPNY